MGKWTALGIRNENGKMDSTGNEEQGMNGKHWERGKRNHRQIAHKPTHYTVVFQISTHRTQAFLSLVQHTSSNRWSRDTELWRSFHLPHIEEDSYRSETGLRPAGRLHYRAKLLPCRHGHSRLNSTVPPQHSLSHWNIVLDMFLLHHHRSGDTGKEECGREWL